MTNDDALREECEAIWMEWKETRNIQGSSLQYVQFTKLLLAFAKRQRAAGVREAQEALLEAHEPWKHHNDLVAEVTHWCEARAKELEDL